MASRANYSRVRGLLRRAIPIFHLYRLGLEASPLEVKYDFAFRGNKLLTMVPRGGETNWEVKSSWPSPSFSW